MTTTPAPDLTAIKSRQQATWSSGDYAVIGTTLQIVGEALCEALDLRAGSSVLDVAAGNGNASLAAARRWCKVTSTDYVPTLLERGRERAAAERLEIAFQTADVEALPFADGAFDVVLSTFGVMFAPDQETSAREMARVCRPGGKIGLANWTPSSMIGELFKVIGRHLPPPAGVKPPSLWGTEERLRELFAARLDSIAIVRKPFNFRYLGTEHFLDVFREFYGPVHKAFAAVADPSAQAALAKDILELLARSNRATDGTLVAPSEYAEVVVTLR